jgi:acetyl esterase/lipase
MTPEPHVVIIDRHRGRSIRSRVLTAALDAVTRPYLRKLPSTPFGPELVASAARFDQLAGRVPPPRGTRLEPVAVDGMAAQWVHGAGVGPDRRRAILYLHGGGWFFGGLNSHRSMTSRLSAAAGVPVLALDYRMVPKVAFEQEVQDCTAGYRWLLARGLAPTNIVIMGDSAGGYLTVATALAARQAGLPMPAALVGLSGVYDLDMTGKAAHLNAERDPTGSLAALAFMVEAVVGDLDVTAPEVSPVRADLAGLPPTLLTVGSAEVIYDDSEQLARRLARAGVPCTLQVWERQPHVFQAFGLLLPEARRSIREVGEFVRAAIGRDTL